MLDRTRGSAPTPHPPAAVPGRSAPPQRRSWLGIALVCAAFFATTLLSYPRAWSGHQVLHAPRDNVAFVLAERFAAGDGFREPVRHAGLLPPDVERALTPRDAAVHDGNVVPKDFAGTMLVYGGLRRLGRPALLLAGPLLGVLSALALVALIRELRRKAGGETDQGANIAALVGAAGWLSYAPTLVHSAYITTADLLGTTFVLLGARGFVRFWRRGETRDFAAMCGWLSAAVLMRYPNAVVALPLALALLATRRIRVRHVLIAAAVGAPAFGAIAVFNQAMYGDAATTGYAIGAQILRASANVAGESFPHFDPEVALAYLRFYVLRYPMLAMPLIAGLAASVHRALTRPADRGIAGTLTVVIAGMVALYAGHDAWGWTGPVVNASVLRYLLPATAIGVAFAAAAPAWRQGPRRALPLVVVAALAGASAWTAVAAPSGLPDGRASHDWLARQRSLVLPLTEPDAIVATARLDRVLFPERQTLTLTYAARNPEPVDIGRRREWDVLPSPERFAEVAAAIAAENIPFYVLVDFPFSELQAYRRAVTARGFALLRVDPSVPRLYQLATPS